MAFLDYFEKRKRTYPQNVKGKFRLIKNISSLIFLTIFFFSPFIRFERAINLPNQAILIDIVHSRAYFFFIKIWPEEAFYFAGLLIFAAVALFFITSLFGRVWCGYSCPQTVWTDLFIKVERFFQGDRNQRIILDRKKSFNKFIRKLATHIVWILISLITGFGFVLYFNDAIETLQNLLNLSLSFNIICWILGVAGMTYIMAGFAREQVCNYMCPYARFQSVMFDNDTLIITYDQKRGEPRQKYKQGETMENRGHCIECQQCVVVCPADIDIRNGLQMECIACGLCVDACDNVMEKIGLPKGLIRYDTQKHMDNPSDGKAKFKLFKARTIYYSLILTIIGSIIIYNLTFKANLDLEIIPTRNPLFVILSNGDIRNSYEIKIYNKSNESKDYSFKIIDLDNLQNQNFQIKVQNLIDINLSDIKVKNDSSKIIKIYVSTNPKNLTNYKNKIKFLLVDNKTSEEVIKESIFITNTISNFK